MKALLAGLLLCAMNRAGWAGATDFAAPDGSTDNNGSYAQSGSSVTLDRVAGGPQAALTVEPWPAVEQPELKQSLEKAPLLQTESLGEPARGVQPWLHDAVPKPDGKNWTVLQWYQEYGSYSKQQLFAIDLATGAVNMQPVSIYTPIYTSGRCLGFDGKYYIFTLTRRQSGGLTLYVYDAATNHWEDHGVVVDNYGGELRYNVVGPDERIYGTDTVGGGQVGLYIYDPKLRKVVKDFGGVGPRHEIGSAISRGLSVDDTHAYILSGDLPFYLVAVHLATGEEKVLFETAQVTMKSNIRMNLAQRFPGTVAAVPEGEGPSYKEYWLYHGEAIPKVNDTPPWPEQASPWDKAGPQPELYYEGLEPDAQGNATLWYRLPEEAARVSKSPPAEAKPEELGWRAIRLKGVETYSGRLAPLALLPDGRIYGSAEFYMGSFLFDPKTDKATPLGRNQGLAPYTHAVLEGKLYSTGYPGGPLFAYDPQKPWTLYKSGPPGHPSTPQERNPRSLGAFESLIRSMILHSSTVGADGKLYFGGFGVRGYAGGSFGWYDAKTEELDGFWKPLSGYAAYYVAPALEGRLMVISTKTAADELNEGRRPEDSKLFFFDIEQGKIVREVVPVPGARTTGLITEVAPGRLLGLTIVPGAPEQPPGGILYGLDVTTGQVLFRKDLPWPVGASEGWPKWIDPSGEYLDLAHGPDGFIWTYLKDVLVRIDPRNASVHVVGKVDPPGRPLFVGEDIYLAGTKELRRIRSIVPKH